MIKRLRKPVGQAVAALSLIIAAAAPATGQAPIKSGNHFVNVLTGGRGGVYYPLGSALSNIIGDKNADTVSSVQTTSGSVANLILLSQGKGEVAFTLGDTLALAWAGDASGGFKTKLDQLRGIAAIYQNYIQIVATAQSGIRTIADLKGKRLSVGARRSGTELNALALLKAAGISYKDLAEVQFQPFDDSVDLMKNRLLDATLQSAGLGVPALREFANTFAINVVEVPRTVVEMAGDPYLPVVIPKGTYRGQVDDVRAAGVRNYLVTRADLDAALVHDITRTIFEHIADLAKVHPAARGIALEHALEGMPVPLHPGAERFFKAKGLIK